MSLSSVVVSIPNYKADLNGNEKISLSRVFKVLNQRSFISVEPVRLKGVITDLDKIAEGNNVTIQKCFFDNHFFLNRKGYNKLLLSRKFYERHNAFDFMLIYQTDAYVFKDTLDYWIELGYDFIGAPWINDNLEFMGQLNGGLSLRRISTQIKVLTTYSRIFKTNEIVKAPFYMNSSMFKKLLIVLRSFLDKNNTFHRFNDFQGNEDDFFTFFCSRNFSWYSVAPADLAMRFSFDMFPEFLFEKCGNVLPFGAHAWQKHSPEFWKNHIMGI